MGLGKKIVISIFILFHWFCIISWILPEPSPVKSALIGWQLPLPAHDQSGWHIVKRQVIRTYLWNTAQWQAWEMFAPDPFQFIIFISATVHFRNGQTEEFVLPRLDQLGVFDAWIQKRYRKYQHNIIGEEWAAYRPDLARHIARQLHRDSQNPPDHVTIIHNTASLPRHDRQELRGKNAPLWIDYAQLLREVPQFTQSVLLNYSVQPEDLR